jgi:hypothetical protein
VLDVREHPVVGAERGVERLLRGVALRGDAAAVVVRLDAGRETGLRRAARVRRDAR